VIDVIFCNHHILTDHGHYLTYHMDSFVYDIGIVLLNAWTNQARLLVWG